MYYKADLQKLWIINPSLFCVGISEVFLCSFYADVSPSSWSSKTGMIWSRCDSNVYHRFLLIRNFIFYLKMNVIVKCFFFLLFQLLIYCQLSNIRFFKKLGCDCVNMHLMDFRRPLAFDHVHIRPEYTVVISDSRTTTCRRKLQIVLNGTCSTLTSSVVLEKDGNVAVRLVHSDPTCMLSLSGSKVDWKC